jgi:hypothetical protein
MLRRGEDMVMGRDREIREENVVLRRRQWKCQRVTNYELRTTDHESRTTHHQSVLPYGFTNDLVV